MKWSTQEFYIELDSLFTFEDRLRFLATVDYDFQSNCQPDAIIQRFIGYIVSDAHAMAVAHVFKKRFTSDIIICRESSAANETLTTLLDDLLNHPRDYVDVYAQGYHRMVHAMYALEFKRAQDCSYHVLWHLYSMDMYYFNLYTFPYDYESIKEYKKQLHRDLMEYIYHPNKIQQWLDEHPGKHIEEYLQ